MNLSIWIASPRPEIIASVLKSIVEFGACFNLAFRAISINKIQGQLLQRCGLYFPRQYSLTDYSMRLFPVYAMLTISLSFWSRAKAKDSSSIHMIMCESRSPKVLYIMKSCAIDFYSADK